MRIVVTKNLASFVRFRHIPALLSGRVTRLELHRAVVDAGRKTRTQVQRAVARQMAVTAGGYQGYVVPNIHGAGNPQRLEFTIRASLKGTDITTYKGLRALSPAGRAARRMNRGRSAIDKGFVKSGVWNNPRTFKRSFAQSGGFFALIPSASASAALPRAFWTFGYKPTQPRGADGKFATSGKQGFRVRRLYGPALGKELDKDQSLVTFQTFGPAELERQVTKRLEKLIRY